jgi:nitric oxide reductase large subunit
MSERRRVVLALAALILLAAPLAHAAECPDGEAVVVVDTSAHELKLCENHHSCGQIGTNAAMSGRNFVGLASTRVRDSISNGYWHVRRLEYLTQGLFHTLEWVRIAGDSVFIVLGMLPIVVATLRSYLAGELAAARR